MKPKPPDLQTAPEKNPIRFKVNVIVPVSGGPCESCFIEAGQPSPYTDIAEVPVNLRAFIVSDDEPERDDESNARFELGVTYQLSSDGRRGRALNRQVARLEAEAEQQEWAEEQLSAPLPAEVADALEDQNKQHVGRAMAQAETHARWLDSANETAERGGDEL